MRTNKIILSVIIAATFLLNPKFAKANTDSTKIFFQQAYAEIKNMLEGKQPMSFEKAIFISENAYLENKFSYENFQGILNMHIDLIKALANTNDKSKSMDFSTKVDFNAPHFDISTIRYTEKEKKELYRKALANWAIFKYMTDTIKIDSYSRLPFTYQSNDPFGMNDWKNSQVINLLSSEEQKGNCFPLVSLFKIFADRLNSEAYICTAPQHIYIQHRDHKGDYYNVELATHSHPGDGSLQTLTYTYHEGIVSGISLRRLKEEKQNVSLCLVNLGKSYEHKFKTRDDNFILQCAELALKYDSLNLNAMLLKEQVYEERVTKYATKKNISDINKLILDKGISATYKNLETQIIDLYNLGYHQMPLYMQQMILAGFQRKDDEKIIVQDRTPNPFPSLKNVAPEDKRYSTLSHGLFEEVHEKKKFEQYGRFTIDTDKKKIVKLLDSTNFQFLIDPVVFAWSVDPMAKKYTSWSPYAAFTDNPILNIDEQGNFSISIHGKLTGNVAALNKLTASQTFFLVAGAKNADRLGFAEDWHFDNMRNFADISKKWTEVNQSIKNRSSWDFYGLGADLHNVQDFYSHSNYVELYVDYYKKSHNGEAPKDIPIYDEGLQDKGFSQILQKSLKTGKFDLVEYSVKELALDKEMPADYHQQMNKDEPGNGKDFFHNLAKKVAQKHSDKIVKEFTKEDKEETK